MKPGDIAGIFFLLFLLTIVAAVVVDANTPRVAPQVVEAPQLAFPTTVESFTGPVPVVVKPNLLWRQQPVYGLFLAYSRRIEIRAGLTPAFARAILRHERCHLALHDAGVLIDNDALEDRICDAIMLHFSLDDR